MTESFVIQSDTSLLPSVEERLFHFCNECNAGSCYSAISVATLQAVENAIVHGNHSDPALTVSLTFATCRGGIAIEVVDQGTGFDFQRYGTLPSLPDTIGEGIFVMQSLADRLTFSEGGNRVRLEFDVSGIDPATALERVARLQAFFSPVYA